jgi:hypothetical protein
VWRWKPVVGVSELATASKTHNRPTIVNRIIHRDGRIVHAWSGGEQAEAMAALQEVGRKLGDAMHQDQDGMAVKSAQ